MCGNCGKTAAERGERQGCDCGCDDNLACGAIAVERNRYFTGKHMTARDFRDEQGYFLSRQRLHNRLMHGWGVVCELEVTPHSSDACPGHVVVSAGIAVDCCGRELVLREHTAFALPLPADAAPMAGADKAQIINVASAGGDAARQANPAQQAAEPQPSWQYLLYLAYDEEPIERVPALYAEDCAGARYEANRVREQPRLAAIEWNEGNQKRYAGCWAGAGATLEPCSKGCGGDSKGGTGCIEPDCPCALGVPLALVTLTKDGEVYRVKPAGIDSSGRKRLPPPREYLTRIVSTNWKHGATISLSELRDKMGGKLIVEFDRKLAAPYQPGQPAPKYGAPVEGDASLGPDALGINRRTFVVQFAGVQDDLEFLRPERGALPQLEDNCKAVFTIRQEYLDAGNDERNVAGNTLYITLKCDFILDCNGNAVDGNFLRGRFPTGDGIEGGTFESWLSITR